MKEKEVSMSELFFDLIFVYVLSQINHTVEHISPSLLTLESLGKNTMLFLVFFAIWIYRTLLVNRFFEKKWYQYMFVFIDMFLVILLSKTINADFEKTFISFTGLTTLIFLSIALQYVLNYILKRNNTSRAIVLVYAGGLLLSCAIATVGLLAPAGIHFWIYFVSVMVAVIFPLLFYPVSKKNPIHFGHLAERLSLFVILLFGEGLIFLVNAIEIEHVTIRSVIYFVFVIMLFWLYMYHYRFGMNKVKNSTGFATAYLHVFIIIAINLQFLIATYGVVGVEWDTANKIGLLLAFLVYLGVIVINWWVYNRAFRTKILPYSVIGIIIVNALAMSFISNISILLAIFILSITGMVASLRWSKQHSDVERHTGI